MTTVNHSLTGALISTVLPLPLAAPLAVASHFVLDALPHYSVPGHTRHKATFWKWILAIDILASVALVFWAIYNQHYAMLICGLLAFAPDVVWVKRAAKTRSFDFSDTASRYEQWHMRIQKHEFPKGLWIEVPLAALLFYIVVIKIG